MTSQEYARELTDAECDAIIKDELGGKPMSYWVDAQRALIRAGCRAVLAAGVARDVCPMCKGRGKVMRPSFSDSSKDIERSCHVCKGSGLIDAAPREPVPEPVAWLLEWWDADCERWDSELWREQPAKENDDDRITPLYTREGGGT